MRVCVCVYPLVSQMVGTGELVVSGSDMPCRLIGGSVAMEIEPVGEGGLMEEVSNKGVFKI